MFENSKYITRGITHEIPAEIQLELWNMIENLKKSYTIRLDYLQVFRLSNKEGKQKIIYNQEEPEYHSEIVVACSCPPVDNKKVFVIDDGAHSTMMLAEEY
ncbi:MAG: DUF960 domain-containing protein [Anaeromusa sp.]|uniref:DUF960 domain-containing protein n=1 Tax=Anaeromusa sp. TaxID=1872520 RepID=UPI002B1EEFA1|nr:DUF960 domain-containing protein [Anaeromusa sp.]MEA4834933.1 DUF960 domain-containing protein [Anaeromusa sp.]